MTDGLQDIIQEVGDDLLEAVETVRKTPLFEPFKHLKTIMLPRQARDKHRKRSTIKRRFECRGVLLGGSTIWRLFRRCRGRRRSLNGRACRWEPTLLSGREATPVATLHF
eukprot:COSAG06_NODE_7313_length_2549_cov_48.716735_1_plen_110_part_00